MSENELEIQIRWLRDSMDSALNHYKSTSDHMMRTFWYSMYEGYARLYHELCEKLHRLEQEHR